MPDQQPAEQSSGGGLDSLVLDPQFSSLKPPDKRRALAGVSGDSAFNGLSDDDTIRYVNAHKATLPRSYTEAGAAANAPIAPLPKEVQPEDKNARVDFDAAGRRITPHTNIIEKAGQAEDDRAMRQSVAMDRAAHSPTPVTNAISVFNPVGAARQVVGGKLGAIAGSKLAPHVGVSPEVGEFVGGTLGGFASNPGSLRMPAVIRRAQQAASESVLAPLTFEGGGETGADVRAGIDPNRALASEKGMTGSKSALVGKPASVDSPGTPGKIGTRVSEVKNAANDILENHRNSGASIDAGAHIDAAIDRAIANSEKTAGVTQSLEDLRTALKTKYGKVQGTPREMNDLATEIQGHAKELGAYKNTQPIETSKASAMSDAARRIRENVNNLVPEVEPLNQRMADLLDARSGITHNLNAERGQSIWGGGREGLWSSVFNKTLGSAPVRTSVAAALNAGNRLEMPPVPAPRTTGSPTRPAGAMPRLGGWTGSGAPSIDAEFEDIPFRTNAGVTDLPSPGRTIIPSRPGVEDVPGPRELGAGPEPQKQLPMPPVRRALPPVNPRNASGAIEAGPSTGDDDAFTREVQARKRQRR